MKTIDHSQCACAEWKFGDVSPSPAAAEELLWFFNEAESAIDQPSTYYAMLAGETTLELVEVERRLEALHSANQIKARLEAMALDQVMLLAGLYLEWPWSRRVERALGCLAGAVACSASFRAEHQAALHCGRTRAETPAEWLEELVAAGGEQAVAAWRIHAERACAVAVRAYERARGDGPSVVPHDEGDEDAAGEDCR